MGKPSIQSRPDPTPAGKIRQVGCSRAERGEPKVSRESDQLIVLGDGRAVHKGKRLAVVRSPQRKHHPDMQGRKCGANLTGGNSRGDASESSCGSECH